MMKECRKSCMEKNRNRELHDNFLVGEDEESFFDLSARTSTGEILNFEQFDGYVTMVINMAKLCKRERPDAEGYFATLEELQKIWPYSLELIVFPFEHPKFNYENEDCADFEKAQRKVGRSIHVMEMADINGQSGEIPPVYRYLKSKAGIDDMDYDIATTFFINPDGDNIEIHQGSLYTIKQYLLRIFENDL